MDRIYAVTYTGRGLARDRWHTEWVQGALTARAVKGGWDQKVPLWIFDSDGYALGGTFPHE